MTAPTTTAAKKPAAKPAAPPPAPQSVAAALQAKFAATRAELAAALIERDDEIDLALAALVAQEHLLLVGPPGLGKSLLLDSLLSWTGGSKFSVLLTKFSVPEELFGPVSVVGLKNDKYVRITTGRLPEADFAFVDEVFKASSAILNTLLKLLNERLFDRGDGVQQKVPLKLCVAASNEWPSTETGKELGALFDRFVFRKTVRPIVSAAGRTRLLWTRDHTPKLSTSVAPAEIAAAHRAATALPWTAAAKDAFETILAELAKEGVKPGDRRQYKAVGAAQAFAWVHGAAEVTPEHLEVLAHVLWDDPAEQPEVTAKVVARVANPTGMRVNQLLMEAEQILAAVVLRDLASATTATTKLGEIYNKLAGLTGNGRLDRAKTYVEGEIRRIKRAALDAR